MADGNIRITLDARQAKVMAQQLESQLKSLDSQAQQTQSSTDKLSSKTRQSADSYRKLVTAANQLVISMRQLGQHTNNSKNSMTQLNASLRQMIQSNASLQASITSLTNSLNNLRSAETSVATGAQNASSSMSGMGASMERTAGIASSLRAILATFGTVLSFQYAAKTLMDFDHAMAQVEAISRATGVQLDALREKAKQLGATTIYTSGEAATGMKYLAQSGFDVNEILTATSSVLALAQAGDIGLAQASEIAAKALRGFRLDATQMSDVADVMAAAVTQSTMNIQEMGYAFKYVAPIAASMGVSMREASAYIGVLSDAGIDATMAGTALRRIMSEISNPTIKATKLLEAHGLTMADVNIKTLGLTKVMENLVNANLSVGETFALFGDRGAPAFQTLAQQIDVVKKKHENLMNVQGRATKMQEVMNQSLYAAFKNLTSAIEFLIIQFSEATGLLNGMKAAMFGVAEGIRFFAKHLGIVVPVVGLLLYTYLPRLITALFGIKTATAAVGATTVVTAATARASWAAIGASVVATGKTIAGCVTSMAALKATAAGMFAALGGWIGIAVLGFTALYMHLSQQKTALEELATKHETLISLYRKGKEGTREYADALKKQEEQLLSLSRLQQMSELDDYTRKLHKSAEEIGDIMHRIREQSNMERASASYKDFAEKVSKIVWEMIRLQEQGKLSSFEINTMRDKVQQLANTLPESEKNAAKLTIELLDNMHAAETCERAIEILRGSLVRLAGEFGKAAEAGALAAAAFRDAAAAKRDFLSGKQMSDLIDRTERSRINTQILETVAGAGLKKNAGRNVLNQSQQVLGVLTTEQAQNLNFRVSKTGQLVAEVKSLKQVTDEYTQSLRNQGFSEDKIQAAVADRAKNYQETAENAKKDAQALNEYTGRLKKETEVQDALNESWKESKKSGGGAAKAAKAQATALGKVNEELARMTMTDREFQQFKFEQELAKLEKTLGKTNPQFQQLVQLWEKAKALGLSSPKELINARTNYEDWKLAQAHGGDKKWAEKAKVDAAADYLRQQYKDDANEQVQIAQWVADRKREITSGSIQKDTQSLLKFWDDYLTISFDGEEQYKNLLNQYYQERYNAYLALTGNETAAHAMAEDERLRKSRSALDGIKVATRDWIVENSNMAKKMGDLMTTIYDGIADAFYNMVATGKANWEDLGRTVLAELTKMIIKTMILSTLMKGIGYFFGFGSGGDAGGVPADTGAATESLFMQEGFFANGGVVSGISAHSNQVVSSPTPFTYHREIKKFARGTAIMGEAGSEAIMPLARDRKGRLGVRTQGGGDAGDGGTLRLSLTIVDQTQDGVGVQDAQASRGGFSMDVMIAQIDGKLAGLAASGKSKLVSTMEKTHRMPSTRGWS